MPVVPTLTTPQVTPEVVGMPRLGAESFGAGTAQEIQKGGESVMKIGEVQKGIEFLQSRTRAKEIFQKYREDLDDYSEKITSDVNNYSTAPGAFKQYASDHLKEMTDALGKNDPMAAMVLSTQGQEHAASLYTPVLHWSGMATRQVDARTEQKNQMLSLREGDFNAYDTAINKSGNYAGYDDKNIGEYKQEQTFNNLKALGEQNPTLMQNLLPEAQKRGYLEEGSAATLQAMADSKLKKQDGTAANTQASKEALDHYDQVMITHPQAVRDLSDAQFATVTKDWTVDDQNKAIVKRDQANRYAPMNGREQAVVTMARSVMPELFPSKDKGGNAIPDNGIAQSSEEMMMRGYLFKQVDAMSEGDSKDPDKIKALIEDAKGPSHYYDGDKMQLLKKYQVPYASSFSDPNTEPGWQTALWGLLPFSQGGQHRTILPAGTHAATPTSGIHKGEDVLQVPRAAGGYNIINAETGK